MGARARGVVVVVVASMLVGVGTASAQTDEEYAPLDQPGPALEAPIAELDAAVRCPEDVATADHDPVLMVPGTTLTTERNYGWNWVPALTAEGIPVCTVELHEQGMADLQRSVENVVHATLSIHEMTGRPVRLIGYSQGGLQLRFALRFWPEVRDAVSEIVQLAAVNHGSAAADGFCMVSCATAIWQMKTDAALVEAINSRTLTFDGVDYSSLYSRYDELATPNTDGQASAIDGATNIALQDVCPLNTADHITTGTVDPVAYALALDALTHPGTADPTRIDPEVCTQLFLPGVDPIQAPLRLAEFMDDVTTALLTAPAANEEPALRCYITASCPARSPASPSPAPAPATAEPSVATTTGDAGLPATGVDDDLAVGFVAVAGWALVAMARGRGHRPTVPRS